MKPDTHVSDTQSGDIPGDPPDERPRATLVTPETAQARSWDKHLREHPGGREQNELAATDTTRLQGHVVEVLSGHLKGGARSIKVWRFRLVRECDAVVIFDTGRFGTKAGYRRMVHKAIDAQFELEQRKKEQTEA